MERSDNVGLDIRCEGQGGTKNGSFPINLSPYFSSLVPGIQ